MRTLALACILLTAGCPTERCKRGTVRLTYTLTGSATAADSIDITLAIGAGTPQTKNVPRKNGDTSIEVDFAKYPSGQSLAFTLTALAGTQPLASQPQTGVANAGCLALSFTLAADQIDLSAADLTVPDLAGVDAAPDLAAPPGADLATFPDLLDPCGALCIGAETCCPGVGCRNLDNDVTACGSCAQHCGTGETCISSHCSCGGGAACANNNSCKTGTCQCLGVTVTCPSKTCCVALTGIDVASYQATVDWTMVKQSGITFVVARATDGATINDSTFAAKWPAIKAAGMYRGAYHFFQPAQDAMQQATAFANAVNAVGLEANDFLAADVETLGGQPASTVAPNLQTFLQAVEAATGHRPVVETNSTFWNALAAGTTFQGYALWVQTVAACPTLPTGWNEWSFWLYTFSATVNGITGNLDGDYFNGTMDDFVAFLGAQSAAMSWTPPGLCGFK